MKIMPLDNLPYLFYYGDAPRDNIVYDITDCIIVGRNHYYPNCLLYSVHEKMAIYSPYDETVMSLNKSSFYDHDMYDQIIDINKYNLVPGEYYFFIYNFDNYFHFLYDTLPYLINYVKLKKLMPQLKLLVNYPGQGNNNEFYEFNLDLFKYLKIDDYVIHDPLNRYRKMYIGSSLTHGGKSNEPPNKSVYAFFQELKIYNDYKNQSNPQIQPALSFHDRIYISRRTWTRTSDQNANIGTNYTMRRRMTNEDQIVNILRAYHVKEIFTEDLTFNEKICLFTNAKYIIGSIGGGLCNLLFSGPNTKVLCIVSPGFLDVNSRFRYSMDHTDITYFNDCQHEALDMLNSVNPVNPVDQITLYTRVQVTNPESYYIGRIGEVIEYSDLLDMYKVNISNNDVAGFNSNATFEIGMFKHHELKRLDNGLNSPYVVDEAKFINALMTFIK